MSYEEFEEVMDSLFDRGLVTLGERDGELVPVLTELGREVVQQMKVRTVQ